MLRRKHDTAKDRLVDAVSHLGQEASRGAVNGAVRRFTEQRPNKVDTYAAGALVLGMANWLSMSLFNFDAVKAVAGRKSVSGRTAYGLIGLSGIYAALRGARRSG